MDKQLIMMTAKVNGVFNVGAMGFAQKIPVVVPAESKLFKKGLNNFSKLRIGNWLIL
jgi:hypothetical protein